MKNLYLPALRLQEELNFTSKFSDDEKIMTGAAHSKVLYEVLYKNL
jgi:hypothetical protein